jgi:hypothetical protein
MKKTNRRSVLKKMGCILAGATTAPLVEPLSLIVRAESFSAQQTRDVFVSRNGTPVTNMQQVIIMAGGIQRFVDSDDVVIIKPNLQWPHQGYTHTQAVKTLIEIVLNRPGGYAGEILIAEDHVSTTDTYQGWAASPENRLNNWPDMNYNEMIADFQFHGAMNVTAAPINERFISGPTDGDGYVTVYYTTSMSPGANGRYTRLGYPIIHSSYSGKLVDAKHGVWSGGGYTGQKAKLFFLPTLNFHSYYAGLTSAVKCHLGFIPLGGDDSFFGVHAYPETLSVGFREDLSTNRPEASGECIGELITGVIEPTVYITVAEYSGHYGRTEMPAAHTRTIGLCTDPVTLDFWMGHHVICPNGGLAADFDPVEDNTFRNQILGCHRKGVGTLIESEMSVSVFDFDKPPDPPRGLRIVREES